MNAQQPNVYPFYFKLAMILLMLSLICVLLYFGQDIIIPFALSILIAVLLIPFNQFLERKKFPRVIAISVSLFISFLFIFGLLYFLSTQIMAFSDDIPNIKKTLTDLFSKLQKWISRNFNLSIREQAKYINNAKDSGTVVLGSTVISLTNTLFVLTLLPIYTFLILYYRDMLKQFIIDLFKKDHREKVQEVLKESRVVVQSYMAGLMIEMGIVALINWIGFMLIGIKYAIFLAVLAAVLNLIPYIGMLIASIFCALIALSASASPSDAIWTLVVLTIVQFIDNNIIMPKVVGSKVKINALITILGVLIGAALAGIPGMFLSIPGIAILKVIFERVEDLKPWGILLSDNITSNKPAKIFEKVTMMSRKPPLK
ncbi:MAG: AI-2E family transporter [Flavitalea sp.]